MWALRMKIVMVIGFYNFCTLVYTTIHDAKHYIFLAQAATYWQAPSDNKTNADDNDNTAAAATRTWKLLWTAVI
jgi:hypothetical protein